MDFLVMEYLGGRDAGRAIGEGATPARSRAPVPIQIADALDKAHRQGIVHATEAGQRHAHRARDEASRLRAGEAATGGGRGCRR